MTNTIKAEFTVQIEVKISANVTHYPTSEEIEMIKNQVIEDTITNYHGSINRDNIKIINCERIFEGNTKCTLHEFLK